jgi:DNA replication protein DnaC
MEMSDLPGTPEERHAAEQAAADARARQPEASAMPAILGDIATPTFFPCTKGCGEQTLGGGPCFDCVHKADNAGKNRDTAEASIPKTFAWARFDNPVMREYLLAAGSRRAIATEIVVGFIHAARDAMASNRVVLYGASGRGKTALAVAMLRGWVKSNSETGLFLYAPDLSSARMRTKLGREADTVLEAITAPLLVLDDVGAGSLAAGPLEEVIHKRHHDRKPTWFTTWMNDATMGQRFGGGFVRRVYEGARCIDLGGAK